MTAPKTPHRTPGTPPLPDAPADADPGSDLNHDLNRDRDGGCGCGGRDRGCRGTPAPLTRNRFFPRKLMEVRHWRAEQDYHRRARELTTRLGLGSGVLCGLEPYLTDTGTVVITAGVAADARGRLVVVPEDVEIDPTRPTDCRGRPTGETVRHGSVVVSLCHLECGADVVAVPPTDCGSDLVCVPSMVREAYALHVTRHHTAHYPTHHPTAQAEPARWCEDPGTRDRACDPDEECVELARVWFGDGHRSLDTDGRTVLRSNRELLDLIRCLAERVEECCRPGPPRVVALWPWPDAAGQAREAFLDEARLELGFDADMAEQGLDDPEPWLGVWALDGGGARRLPVQRAGGALTHVSPPGGGDAAAWSVEVDREAVGEDTVFVVMARSASGGPVRAESDEHLALDAELAATGLSVDARDRLWSLRPGARPDPSLAGLADDAVLGPPPWLPTGDGTPGGELHLVLRTPTRVRPVPRLLAIWPPGGAVLDQSTAERLDLLKSYLRSPRIEIVVSRPLAPEAVADPAGWLRAWQTGRDGELIHTVSRLPMGSGREGATGNGTVRYVFPVDGTCGRRPDATDLEVLVQLRSTPPLMTGSPRGRDEPHDLLDAYVRGTALDSQTLITVWKDDALPAPLPGLGARTTVAGALQNGIPGGLAHWAYRVGRA
ncbi:hypothetical protein ACFYOV_28745 [Streptomyces sp. NPDC005931]|uniref:hypothetical protein n=1 Tax=Streptomyces sp. NPDC005931 TaxID=3364737 RepID=UPI00368E951F